MHYEVQLRNELKEGIIVFKIDFSKINKFLMGSVIGAIIVGIITSAIYDTGKDSITDNDVSKETVVALDKLLKQATKPLKDRMKELENELQKSLTPEEIRIDIV